jgi:hypothetical protein
VVKQYFVTAMNFNSFFLWLLMKGRFEVINYKTNRPASYVSTRRD